LSSVGCTHLYKNYDYEIHKDSRKGELLVVELYGSWKKISENPEITKKGNPYQLDIDFYTNDLPGESITLIVDKLVLKSGIEIPIGRTRTKQTEEWWKFGLKYKYKSTAKNRFFGINISKHESIQIVARLEYKGTIRPIDVVLNPNYNQSRHSNYFDGAMGI